MIITKEVVLNSNGRYNNYYRNLGYLIKDNKIIVKTEDLQLGSHALVVAKCDVCGKEKEIEFRAYNIILYRGGYSLFTCSPKCGKVKTEQTCERIYGVKIAAKSDIVKQNAINNCMIKHGVPYHTTLPDVIAKKNATVEKKYNVKHTFQAESVKDKIKITMNERYNCDHALQYPDFLQKMKDTCEERIGFDNPSKCEKIVKHRVLISDNKAIEYFSNLLGENFTILLKDEANLLIRDNRDESEFIIDKELMRDRLKTGNEISTLKNPVNSGSSTKEIQIFEFITGLGLNPTKEKTILEGKELDVYISSHKIALEHNGLYYHNEDYRPKYYHLEKSYSCEEKGIELFHIWESEWLYNRETIKSMIKTKLDIYDYVIDGHDCVIKENINNEEIYNFLNLNNIVNYKTHDINMCLYYNDELVSIMLFNEIGDNEYLLLDMCNKINVNVVDSYNILLKNFTRNYIFDKLISYSDYRIFNGNQDLYVVLGFKHEELLDISYFWSRGLKTYSDSDLSDKELISDIDNITETEYEIIYEIGYRRVYNCGQIKWTYIK